MTDRTHPNSGRIISSSDILLHDAKTALMYEELRAAIDDGHENMTHADALAEIAAIRAENEQLRAKLESIGAGGVSGPLMGKPQEMPDLSALTERGAKAWAGVDAQGLREGFTAADMATAEARGFRDGVASLAASAVTNCERCSGSGEDPEGFYEQSRGDAGHTHDGPCRSCGGSGAAASAGSEPVAWRLRNTAFRSEVYEYFKTQYLAECRQKQFNASVDDGGLHDLTPLYLHPSPPEGMVGGWTKPHRTITYTCPVCVASLERQK